MATILGDDLRTHVVKYVPPGRELGRLSAVSKGWHKTVTSYLPPSVARLAVRCEEVVLMQSAASSNYETFWGYLTSVRDGAGDFWDPRVVDRVPHVRARDPWKSFLDSLHVISELMLAFPSVGFEGGGKSFRGDLRTGKVEELEWAGPCSQAKKRQEQELEALSFDWEGLEERHRKIDLQASPDDNWTIVALNTGSVQIFDLSRKDAGDTRRFCLKPPSALTRVLSMECSGNFLALTRLLPDVHPDYQVPMQFRIELWNWRAQTELKVWQNEGNPYPTSLKFQITDHESYMLVGYPFRGVHLLSSHATPFRTIELSRNSCHEWFWDTVCSWFSSISSCVQSLFNKIITFFTG